MAIKFKGLQATGSSYRVGSGIPLDQRLVVSSYSDLFNENTFLFVNKQNNVTNTQTAYLGMVVAVVEDADTSKNGLYLLTATPSTIESNWIKVGSDGTSSDVTSLMIETTTDELYTMVVNKTLIPGMKYRITDYDLKVDTSIQYNKDLICGRLVINKRTANFDIIATAATTADLFADVELCDKTEATSRIYIGWKAKYDIIGNAQPSSPGMKTYDYIEPTAKGVIYYMEDNFGNSADYDFDNLLYRTIQQNVVSEVMNVDHFTFSVNKKNSTEAINLLSVNTPEHQVVSNVKIKSISKYQLPFVFFKYDMTDMSETETLFGTYTVLKNINISHSEGVVFRNIILRNTSITNSMSVAYVISPLIDTTVSTTRSMLQYMSIFDNLKIDGCRYLSSSSYSGDISQLIYTNTHDDGTSSIIPLYINNINIESYHGGSGVSRSFPPLRSLCVMMLRIIKEGLSNANIIATEDDVYLSAIGSIEIQNPKYVSRIFNDSDEIYQSLTTSNDKKVYKMIKTSIKNLTYTIFNLNNALIEMPQFQSTATSVVELGLN